MTMHTAVRLFSQVLTLTLLLQPFNCWAVDSQDEKIAALITKSAQKIGGAKKIGVGNVTMDWQANSEVKEIAAFESGKRIGVLTRVIDNLSANEEKIFPDIKTNTHQMAAAIITRMLSLDHLSSLIASSDYDVVVKDYLDGEIADLKLMLNGKINYGAYLQSREMRDNKRAMLLNQNYDCGT